MKAFVFRHGGCKYAQRETSVAGADDLTLEGVRIVKASAIDLVNKIGLSDGKTQIVSSPFGRTLHTAMVIKDSLVQEGITVGEITVERDLGEIRGFEYATFLPLVIGGKIEYEGEKFNIDRNLTNPGKYGPIKYFRTDSVRNLPQKVRAGFPGKYLRMIDEMETYEFVANRFRGCLDRLSGEDAIIVTHEALTGDFVERVVRSTTEKTSFLERGKYISFEKGVGGGWNFHYMPEGAVQFEDVG